MNANDYQRLDALRRARGLVALIDGTHSARAAWRLVDAAAELDRQYGRFAAGKATQRWGHRPCARVGLKTKPFRVVHTKKTKLSQVGRIIGGHRRLKAR